MYPTGNTAQTGTVTLSVTVPVINDGIANDFILSALKNQIYALADPSIWDDVDFSITAAEAAAYGQTVVDSITLT